MTSNEARDARGIDGAPHHGSVWWTAGPPPTTAPTGDHPGSVWKTVTKYVKTEPETFA